MTALEPQASGSSKASELTAELILRAFRKHWQIGTVVAVGVVIGTVFFTIGRTKIYRSTSILQIEPKPIQPLGRDRPTIVELGSGSYWMNKEYYQTQYKLIGGKEVLLATVKALALNIDLSFFANLPAGAMVPTDKRSRTADDAAIALSSRVKVEPIKDSRLVTVTVDDANPNRARRILATLTHVYMDMNVERAVSSTSEASTWLSAQVASLKDDLEKSELALHEYKKDKHILSVSMDDQSNMLREEMRQLDTALTAASARREQLQSHYDEIAKVNANEPTNLPATEMLQSSLLSALRQEYSKDRSALAEFLGAGKGENHPEAIAAQARVATTRDVLMAEVKNVQGALQSELTAVSKEVSGLAKLYHAAEQRAFDLNLLEIEFRRLERTKTNTEKLYGLVLERSKESDLSGLMRFNNIRVTEEADVPRAPVSPSLPKNLTLGFLGGLFLGAMFTLARELLDRRVRGPDEVERDLGQTLLGVVPALTTSMDLRRGNSGRRATPVAEPERLAHDQPSSNLAEAARGIRTNLTFMCPDRPFQRILVTSASPGDGKTMVACTLAISLAQTGQRVLLMDCDLRRSRVHRVFARTNSYGVTNATLEPGKIDYASLATDVPNLSVLTSGPRIASPSELLQSEALRKLLDELAGHFDRIILDSPPVGPVSDAAILTARVDTTVFVIRSNKTLREVARRGARSLREVGAQIAGCVLNALPIHRKGYYYYHSNYYSYSDSYRYGENRPS